MRPLASWNTSGGHVQSILAFRRLIRSFVVLAMCMSAQAQTNRGTLSGTVLDGTGAVIPGAQLTATNNENGTVYKTVSTGAGSFQIQQMSLGTYTVNVTAPGFKATTQTGVLIQIAQVTALDVRLGVGQANETVNVDASGTTLETESSDISTVIDSKQVIDLPLSLGGQKGARAPEAFVFLTPGTVAYGSGSGNAGPSFFSKTSGGQNFSTEVILDGASTFRSENGSTFDETSPSVESIGEFKVLTSTLPAEYGRTTGGIEIFSSHQGGNLYHGSAFEIYRNEALDANNLFNNIDLRAGRDFNTFRKPKDRQNDYGGSLSGPVIIPHVYNGKNRTFFFFDFEAYRQNVGATRTNTIHTTAVRSGNFSAYLGGPILDANNKPLINPCTGNPVLNNQIFDPATQKTVGGVLCRSEFAGNIIPSPRFSSVAKNVLALLPPVQTPGLRNNYTLASSSPNANTLMTIRVDQNFGQNNKVYVSSSSRENTPNINPNFAPPIDNQNAQDFTTHYIRVGYDHTFSPTLLNHLNLGYNRTNSVNFGPGAKSGIPYPSQLGIGNVVGNTFPNFNFGDSATGISGIGSATDNDTIDNGYRLNDSVTKSLSRHTMTIGGDYRYQKFFPIAHNGETGSFNFSRNQTSFQPGQQGSTGLGFASFLLGQLDGAGLSNYAAGQPHWLYSYGAVYAQDDYKVFPTLTLNLGVRWDVDLPRRERDGNTSNFSPTAPNPGANGLPGALVFAGTGTGRNGNAGERWAMIWKKDFAPRIGFAWSPNFYGGKSVLRGGYGIYYGALTPADFGGSLRDGFAANPNKGSPNGYDAAFNIDTGFPVYAKPPFLDPTQDNNNGINYIKPSNGRPAMVNNWSLEVEQQLATDLVLNIGYVGQHSTFLHSSFSSTNNLPVKDFALGNHLFDPAGGTSGVPLPYPTFNNQIAQALRPFPQYTRINTDCCLENEGVASFNALEVQLKRRYHNGLNLLASYTFSKTLTDADSALPFFATLFTNPGSPQNPENKKGEKSISTQDLPSNFVVSYLYELPIGRGKKYLSTNKTVSNLVGGITIGGVQRYESGQPYAFGGAGATGVPSFDEGIRLNRTGKPIYNQNFYRTSGDPRSTSIFNSNAFDDPNSAANRAARGGPFGGAFGFGNVPRVTSEVRTHPYWDEDFSFIKRTKLSEHIDIDLKINFLNAFNRKILNRANSNGPGDGGFGTTGGTILGPRQVQPELRLEF